MFSKPVLMKCGHYADTIVVDVPFMKYDPDYKGKRELADVAACGFCFDNLGTVNQPAVAMEPIQPVFVKPPTLFQKVWNKLFS